VPHLKYPNVECEGHPGFIAPGYAVCPHILNWDDVGYMEEATPSHLGVVSCQHCYDHRHEYRDEITFGFHLMCKKCVMAMSMSMIVTVPKVSG
jgi:hypothetical protein